MSRQWIGVMSAVLALVLATGMSIAPELATSPMRTRVPDAPAAGVATDVGSTDKPLLSPDGYRTYFAAVLTAEVPQDPVQRCLAYPPLPGNDWPTSMVEALCALVPLQGSLGELEKVLKQHGGGAELDRRYAALLEANYAGPSQKDHIFRAYDIFDETAHAAAVAQEWVRQSPESAFARTARAWQLVESGWHARGAKYARETSQEKLGAIEGYFARAIPDLAFALKQNPKLIPACERLISIGANSNDQMQAIGTNVCLKEDPASYRVMRSLLWAAQPKWGGSQEQMRAFVAIARAHETDNPALAALRNYQAGYEAAEDRADNRFARTAPMLERVSRISPGYLQETSHAMVNLDRPLDAFVYASQAIRFKPDDADAYYDRANALLALHEFGLAFDDANQSKALSNDNGWPEIELTESLNGLKRYLEAREHAILAMSHPATRQLGNEALCRSYWFTHELDTMASCTEKLVVDFPGSDEAWRLRAVAYKDAINPKMYDAVDDFLQRAEPKGQASEITWFKGWQLTHPRPGSAASVSEATYRPASKP